MVDLFCFLWRRDIDELEKPVSGNILINLAKSSESLTDRLTKLHKIIYELKK